MSDEHEVLILFSKVQLKKPGIQRYVAWCYQSPYDDYKNNQPYVYPRKADTQRIAKDHKS